MGKSGDNMPITTSRYHDCDKHYELKKRAKFFHCDGCKMNGFGERYKCNRCNNELHKECRNPIKEVSHENFAGSDFKFHKKPFTKLNKKNRKVFSKRCVACGKEICGFNYHCKEDKKDLHPCCRKLEKKLVIDGMIFDLETKVSSKCGKCGKRENSRDGKNVLGWSYVSSCKKYHFHVFCIIEVVQEAYMKYRDLKLENLNLRKLVRNKRNKRGGNTFLTTIKSVIKILLSAPLGDPMLILNVLKLFSRAILILI